jgi:acetyl-CoA synthetase
MDIWRASRRELDGLPGGRGLNIAYEALDRHVARGDGDRVAFRFLDRKGGAREVGYAEMALLSNRFANVLESLGVGRGDTVCTLSGRIPELYITALGALKAGAVFCPLFSSFGPEPIRIRLEKGSARVLVTTEALFRSRVADLVPSLPALRHVVVAGGEAPGALSFERLMDAAGDEYAIAPTDPEDPALLHFTSGTTGAPKGAVHVHEAVVAHHATGKLVLGLRPGDVYWCSADPGWVTGVSYGIVAPLVLGATSIVDEGEFDAERWCRVLRDQRVAVWYTAPTAIRMLRKVGIEVVGKYDFRALRLLASAGEPLNPDDVVWGREAFGEPFHDTWWQTETGAIMVANLPGAEIAPGSMGRPVPGVEAAVVRQTGPDSIEIVDAAGVEGELALKPGWPSMFRGYLGDDERYRRCFAGGYYLTGDLVRRDADGRFWFVGRRDDMIKSAGHLIGPFEVESALREHPAVAEAAVIGKPDPVVGETIKAFVSLKDGVVADDRLRREILGFARKRLGPAVAPREISYQKDLPKTRSGKIMRRLLKARELGLPEGDTSTLEIGTDGVG